MWKPLTNMGKVMTTVVKPIINYKYHILNKYEKMWHKS